MTLSDKMRAMVTMGHGDPDQMVLHKDRPNPEPVADDVLIPVLACGRNNTDVNTRSGWYSKAVCEATTDVAPIPCPLAQLREAQAAFIAGHHTGTIVIIP